MSLMSERSFYDKNEPEGEKHTAPEKQTSSTVFMFLLSYPFILGRPVFASWTLFLHKNRRHL